MVRPASADPTPNRPPTGPPPALVAGLAIAAALTWLGLAAMRPGLERIWGDEGTFVAMTASLARDGDLAFGPADRAWATERVPGAGVTVILQRTGDGVAYSKPILYPLIAAPFYRLAGEPGMVAANALALAVALLLAWGLALRIGPPRRAAMTILTFTAASALPAYIVWRMSDALQAALALGGLALALGCLRPARPREPWFARPLDARWAAVAGGAALGAAASMRLPNLALAAAAVAALALAGRRKRALAAAAGALATLALLTAATAGLTGTANPYRAERSSFNAELGYPPADTEVPADGRPSRFDSAPATRSEGFLPHPDLRTAFATLYFFLGRHSGLLVYFPAALVAGWWIFARGDRLSAILGLAVAAMAGFYLLWLPANYFGGATFVGNRYFLTAYPALLVGLARLPPARAWLPVWGIAAAAALSAWVSIGRPAEVDRLSQSHASAGLFRLLPYESTAREIDGQRDRYWAGDFVRFVDPYAHVDDDAFRLASDRPAAEIEVAEAREGSAVTLLVAADHPRAMLEFSDWGGAASYPLVAAGQGSNRVVRIDPSTAWRRHPFWWSPEALYEARTLRLSVRAPDGEPVSAEVRYLGDGRLLDRALSRRLSFTAPRRAAAGGVSAIAVELTNTGDWSWSSDGPLPVFLSHRIFSLGGEKLVEGERQPIRPVLPGDTLATELPVAWPADAGPVLLEVDLIVRHLAWFGDRGSPAPRRRVAVRVP